jgi:uncharacterized membrane protein YdjX (TVP38/TMEM64 family)
MEERLVQFFIQTVNSLQGNSLSPLIFVFFYAMACFIFPVSLFPVAGGILFGFWGGLVLNVTSVLIGATGPFFLARRMAGGTADKFLRSKASPAFLAVLADHRFTTFLTIRLVGFPPFVVTNYLAGIARMPLRIFLSATFVGMLPWTVLLTYFADTFWKILVAAGMGGFRQALLQYSRPLLFGALLFAGLVIAAILVKRRKEKSSETTVNADNIS